MFKLPDIDFNNCVFLDSEVIEFHYEKHHRTYVNNLNDLLKGRSVKLSDLLRSDNPTVFNNVAQMLNHTLYWLTLTPQRSDFQDGSNLLKQIEKDFGSLDRLKKDFINQANSVFGSGWTWLAFHKELSQIEIINTSNAGLIDFNKYLALLICDVWEHAYYIDYRNSRANYLEDFWEAINWNFAEENFKNSILSRIETLMIHKK